MRAAPPPGCVLPLFYLHFFTNRMIIQVPHELSSALVPNKKKGSSRISMVFDMALELELTRHLRIAIACATGLDAWTEDETELEVNRAKLQWIVARMSATSRLRQWGRVNREASASWHPFPGGQ